MRFDEHYRETAELRDGRRVALRTVRPDDKDLLRRGFERLSPESRYRRFLSNKKALSDHDLAYLTEVDGFDHFALGATGVDPDGAECGVGIARFIRSREDSVSAEPAIAVADDWQRNGLGALMLRRLVEAARERGVEFFEARALAVNTPLLEILGALGAGVQLVRDDDEVAIRVDLPSAATRLATPPPAAAPKPPLERLLELAGRELVAVATRLTGRKSSPPS